MAAGLYRTQPDFAHWIDTGAQQIQPLLNADLREVLCHSDRQDIAAADILRDTAFAQPALYLMQYATAQLWASRGVVPDVMIGHSVGEFTAAALAGIFDFKTGLDLVTHRGRMMRDMQTGAMLSVRASLHDLKPFLTDDVDLAASNAPKLQVIAGPHDAIDRLAKTLAGAGIATGKLHTSHAFHSLMMQDIVAPLEQLVAKITLNAPEIPMISSVTGTRLTQDDAQSPGYWARQARATVNFQAAIQSACKTDIPVFLEMGAGRTLSTLTAQCLERGSPGRVFQSLPDHTPSSDDEIAMAAAFAQLWGAGLTVDWAAFGPRGAARVSLPAHPFLRKRHWVDPPLVLTPETGPQNSLDIGHPMIQIPAAASPALARTDRLVAEIAVLLSDLSGEVLTPDKANTSFLEFGFDSLFMGQVSQALQKAYGVTMSFRDLLATYPNMGAIARHLDTVLPPDAVPSAAPARLSALPAAPSGADISALIQAQLQTMQSVFADQLRFAGGAGQLAAPVPASPLAMQDASPVKSSLSKPTNPDLKDTKDQVPVFNTGRGAVLGQADLTADLTADQLAFAQDLGRKCSAKFAKSKAHADTYRPVLADPRTAAGFRDEWKELTFPIVAAKSKGAYIDDIDGNRLIDLVNGFGQTAFGHAPDFVNQAVTAQLASGYAIGPQSDLAGVVAEKFARMTGHQRVTFCNTGSEAVMAAMRLARAVTGRDRIVVFGNDYHGQFDEVLVKGRTGKGEPVALPVAPGIPRSALGNMTVLEYGSDAALEWIKANAGDIAAVIVEPVQSRHPSIRPVAFLHKLRDITADSGTALVFDEVVTGFRTHPRGMQGVWNIKADMATYGKVVGGGMPVGVLAGDARFMDALDGGAWAYGDDSKPEVAPTFFAGTFVRHPLVLAAVNATLDHMAQNGPVLWEETADKTAALVARLNRNLTDRGLPQLVKTYSSWFVINLSHHDPRATLFFALMRLNGVHLIDGYCGFMTTAHTDADIAAIESAFITSIDALQKVGIAAGTGTGKNLSPTPIPLTENQREIWATHQLGDRAACSFNESVSFDLAGPLDRAALTSAVSAITQRHDALRLVFARDGSGFVVADATAATITDHDFSATDDPQKQLDELLAKNASEPLAITVSAPVRFNLVKLAEDHHVLVVTAHHIVCDGWSFGVILEDLASLYDNRVRNQPDTLAPAPSFADHARAQINKPAKATTLDFWRNEFATIPALPDLPVDAPRPAIKTFNGATATARFDGDLALALRKTGGAHGCTLFATLFAGLQLTIGQLSGTNDIVLAVPSGGQALLENQNLVGHCVNLLPVHAAFDPALPVSAHLSLVKTKLLDAFDHQDTTYGTLIRAFEIKCDFNRLPLTEIQFNLEQAGDPVRSADLSIRTLPNPKAAANFDLFFNIAQSRDGLRIDVDYNADIFERSTVDRWISVYRDILVQIGQNADQTVATLFQRHGVSAATRVETPRDARTVDQLVGQQINRTPEAIAIEDNGGHLTYGDLGAASDALASLIQSRVSTPCARIAVALPRDKTLPAALLAVLKAGHAYIPLDPRQPAARLRAILEQANAAAVIVDDPSNAGFADGLNIAVLTPSQAKAGTAPQPVARSNDDTAYIIFTSGSTGAPKGVEIPHSAVVNFLNSMSHTPGISARDRLLSVTTVMFDIAVLELFSPLICGGRVVLAATEDVIDAFAIVDRLGQGDITVMQATPTLWDILLDAGFTATAPFKILSGGEPLPQDLAARLTKNGAELWNLYGPTETTIWSALQRIGPGMNVTIGHPIDNTELHILGPFDDPVPAGDIGELNIGGAGLAKGYINQPDLTAKAFRNVTLNGSDRRLYRTGDLARRLPTGELEILGRADSQVKLRGFRIELGEIETHLRRLPGVAKAAAAVQARANGDMRLTGYLVARDGHTLKTSVISAALAGVLPDYMIPQSWVMLKSMPQTTNGKLDRASLPAPDDRADIQPLTKFQPAVTDTEKRLTEIWTVVLGLDQISVADTLYALGADSLTIFRIAARQLAAGLDLDARDLLTHLTIRDLAAFADSKKHAQPTQPMLSNYCNGARRNKGAA